MRILTLKSALTVICFFILLTADIYPQKKIVENISVEEWIVPVYAINSKGRAVRDLKAKDIELFVNGIKIPEFNFIRRQLFEKQKKQTTHFELRKEDEKTIIFVFDTALSKATSIMKSKIIAKRIVEKSERDTKFLVFRIEPFWGLNYIAGPINNKKKLLEIFSKRIGVKENRRSVDSGIAETDAKYQKYDGADQSFFLFQQTKYLNYKSSQFALSFRSLYYSVSNLIGTKFVYLFSEGISNASWLPGDIHGETMAKYLAKSGAVLFFINPAGGKGESMESGEGFLRNLAKMSGGRYIIGDTKMINREIDDVQKAYYELTFHTPENFRADTINISIISKIKGVKILTIRNLERSKNYLILTDTEKKLLVLNIISKNSFFRLPLSVEDAKIEKRSEKNGFTDFRLSLPEHFIGRPADIYTVHTSKRGGRPKIKVKTEKIDSGNYTVRMRNIPGYNNNFVLINYELGFALVKGVKMKKIEIKDFRYSGNILNFKLTGFSRKKIGDKNVALLKITVKLISSTGLELSTDTKELTLIKNSSILRIPVKKEPDSNFYILIIAKDMISKQDTNLTRLIKRVPGN